MATPLKKEQPDFHDENLDQNEKAAAEYLAYGKPPVSDTTREGRGPQIVETDRDSAEMEANAHLFPNDEMQNLRTRWKAIQAAFVDDPRSAVEQADGLVSSATKRLADVFSGERSRLEKQWDHGENVSTEDLRVTLQRYRTFFERLLSV